LPPSIGGKDMGGEDGEAVVFGIVERGGDALSRHVQMRPGSISFRTL
jgi:hypothetical protein